MDEIILNPIGYVKSLYDDVNNMPKSSLESMDVEGQLVIDEKYMESMTDIKADEEYMLIFYFHKSEGYKQQVPLRGVGPVMGLFSTHAPNRPNPIGVSTIKIKEVKDNIISFNGVDMLNNTPILDIKKIYK